MSLRVSLLASFCVAAGPLLAEPASPEGAARIEAGLRAYLGQTSGVVAVVPKGETYALTLDATPLLALAKEAGATGAISPMHLTLTDQGGGLWGVEQDEPFAIKFDLPGTLSLDMGSDAMRWTGVFDEALMAFVLSEARIENMRVNERITDPSGPTTEVTYMIDSVDITSDATAALGGGVDTTIRYSAFGISENFGIAAGLDGVAPGLSEPMQIGVTAARYDAVMTGKGLRTEGIFGLLSWFVAHSSTAAIEADLDGLKAAVRGALPFWNSLDGEGELHEITVTTPFGSGGADSAQIAVEMSGAVADGRFREMISVKGLDLPTDVVPDWVPALLPKEVTFDFAVSGFDLAAPASFLLDELGPDFNPGPVFEARMLEALLPDGKVTITLGPQGVASAIYTLDVGGGFDAGPGVMPEGSVTIGATGIEAVLEALNAAPEEVRSGAVPGLMMLRGIAKPAGVGRFVWTVEMTPDGKVTVNGLDMSALGGQQ